MSRCASYQTKPDELEQLLHEKENRDKKKGKFVSVWMDQFLSSSATILMKRDRDKKAESNAKRKQLIEEALAESNIDPKTLPTTPLSKLALAQGKSVFRDCFAFLGRGKAQFTKKKSLCAGVCS